MQKMAGRDAGASRDIQRRSRPGPGRRVETVRGGPRAVAQRDAFRVPPTMKKAPSRGGGPSRESGGDLLSHTGYRAVPSARRRFTSVFGMGTGGSTVLWPPKVVSLSTTGYRGQRTICFDSPARPEGREMIKPHGLLVLLG
jgi:hypothetical protein